MFEEYEKIANKSIEDSIKSETHGSLEEAMLTVGKRWSSMLRYTCVSQPWGSVEAQHQRAKGPKLNSKCWVPVLTINQGKPPYQPPLSACTIYPDTGATGEDPESSMCSVLPKIIPCAAHVVPSPLYVTVHEYVCEGV